jgi:hypothetical protein
MFGKLFFLGIFWRQINVILIIKIIWDPCINHNFIFKFFKFDFGIRKWNKKSFDRKQKFIINHKNIF